MSKDESLFESALNQWSRRGFKIVSRMPDKLEAELIKKPNYILRTLRIAKVEKIRVRLDDVIKVEETV